MPACIYTIYILIHTNIHSYIRKKCIRRHTHYMHTFHKPFSLDDFEDDVPILKQLLISVSEKGVTTSKIECTHLYM